MYIFEISTFYIGQGFLKRDSATKYWHSCSNIEVGYSLLVRPVWNQLRWETVYWYTLFIAEVEYSLLGTCPASRYGGIQLFLQFIILDFYNFTKILGQNIEISNTNHKSFHFHYCCVCCHISLSDNSLHSAPFGANLEEEKTRLEIVGHSL